MEVYEHRFTLTAGESDATGHLGVGLLTERLIEVATEHANLLGIGYAFLIKLGKGWVLSRLSVEMSRYPAINEEYVISTWIESFTSRFSERNMRIARPDGTVLGYARTLWVAIDFERRALASLDCIENGAELVSPELECPIAKHPRLKAPEHDVLDYPYTFRYCDLDYNRHVNTVRYLDLLLNRWPLSHFDAYMIGRLDVTFSHECYFGDEVNVRVERGEPQCNCEIVRAGTRTLAARITWTPRL